MNQIRLPCAGHVRRLSDFSQILEVPQPNYYQWRQLYGGMQAEKTKLLTQLEE